MDNERVLYDWDYEVAEKNGIIKRIANERFYRYKWDKERAITEKVQKPPLWSEYKDLALAKGVSYQMFQRRTGKGMEPLAAIDLGRVGNNHKKRLKAKKAIG